MGVFLVATGPALALFARRNDFQCARTKASLTPSAGEIDPFPSNFAKLAYDRTEVDGFEARNRGDTSKLPGQRYWPGQR
jgi:hypothetical protein